MVVGDNTPVWSDLGQTSSTRHHIPGHRVNCGSDAYGATCPAEELFGIGVPGHDRMDRYASDNSSEMFGMGDENMFGQVLFPNIKRADYAVNPLSGFGQVLFPNIKRADYAVNPLSGFGTVRIPDTESIGTVRVPDSADAFAGYFGTVRVPDDANAFSGYFGQTTTTPPADAQTIRQRIGNWGLAPWIAAAALLGGAYFAKGTLKTLLQGMGVVAGGMGAVQLAGKLTSSK